MHAQGLPPAGQPLAGEVTARWLTSKWQIQMLMQNGNYLSLHAEVVPRGYFKTLRVTAISPAVQMLAACIVAERFQFSSFASRVGLAVLAWMLHFYSQWLPFPYSCFTSSFLQSSEKAAALIHSSPFFLLPITYFPAQSHNCRSYPARVTVASWFACFPNVTTAGCIHWRVSVCLEISFNLHHTRNLTGFRQYCLQFTPGWSQNQVFANNTYWKSNKRLVFYKRSQVSGRFASNLYFCHMVGPKPCLSISPCIFSHSIKLAGILTKAVACSCVQPGQP